MLSCSHGRHPLHCLLQLVTSHEFQVSFGESHKVVGGHPSLGDWDVSNAPQMQWNDGNVWTLEVQLPEGSDIEFKVTVLKSHFSIPSLIGRHVQFWHGSVSVCCCKH